jgi:hypothetical protein
MKLADISEIDQIERAGGIDDKESRRGPAVVIPLESLHGEIQRQPKSLPNNLDPIVRAWWER